MFRKLAPEAGGDKGLGSKKEVLFAHGRRSWGLHDGRWPRCGNLERISAAKAQVICQCVVLSSHSPFLR